MADVSVDVKINFKRLKKFKSIITKSLKNGTGPIATVHKQWGAIYRSFIQLRYDRFSRGGGDWPSLASSTVKRRRKESTTILRDTNTLFSAFNPVFTGQNGQFQRGVSFGIEIGVKGGKHPGGFRTVSQIVRYHQDGGGRLPQRKIVVDPTQKVVRDMEKALNSGIQKIVNDHNRSTT